MIFYVVSLDVLCVFSGLDLQLRVPWSPYAVSSDYKAEGHHHHRKQKQMENDQRYGLAFEFASKSRPDGLTSQSVFAAGDSDGPDWNLAAARLLYWVVFW